jgi:DNA polymerase III sliding clamp (beta) subunit (PCNA family)
MHPITLPVAELKPALAGLGKVVNSRTSLAILTNIKIERTADGWIALTGTDLDRFVTVRLEHPAEGPPATVLVPYEQLVQITKNCGKDEQIQLAHSAQGPVIKFALAAQLGETKVIHVPVEEFPITPRIQMDAIPLAPEVRRSIHEAMDCASVDSTRYVLNGTFIDTSNPKANYIIGTDGRHLYSANSFTLPLKNSLIIPNHKFLEWKEFNADGEWQIKADDQHVQLSSRRWRFISKQIEGKYPDWRTPIPNPNTARTTITLDPAKLEPLIKLIQRMPCHDDETLRTIGLSWNQGQLLLLGKDTPDEPWLRVPVPDAKGNGPSVTTFVDRRYLIKALSFGLNTLSLIDPMSPLRFHSAGRQMIVMPLRSSDEPPPEAKPPAPSPALTTATTTNLPRPAEQPQKPQPMQTQPQTNGSSHPAAKEETKTALEAALVQVESIKAGFREAINGLSKLGDTIRHAMREQKASEKEVHNVRQTLRSLQSVRL